MGFFNWAQRLGYDSVASKIPLARFYVTGIFRCRNPAE